MRSVEEILKLSFEENDIYFYNDIDKNEDLDLNSLTLISLIVSLEKHCEIDFPSEILLETPKTYNDFYELIKKIKKGEVR